MSKLDFRPLARIGYLYSFYEISLEALSLYFIKKGQLVQLENQGTDFYEDEIDGEVVKVEFFVEVNEINKVSHEMEKEIIKIVIFLSTFLEAYIWELGAVTLGETFTQNHLDKLDTISKWKIIPKLVTGKDMPIESWATADFKKLIKTRNTFVHHKTKDLGETVERLNKSKEKFMNLYEMVDPEGFFKLIKHLFQGLDKIDTMGGHIERLNRYAPQQNV